MFLLSFKVGLAVDDIKAVQEQARLKRFAMQVTEILKISPKKDCPSPSVSFQFRQIL